MKESTDGIVVTHAGSLPRPEPLTRLMYELVEGRPYDAEELDRQVTDAVADVVARQREIGIDVVSDGEMGKSGFSSYVTQRFDGYEVNYGGLDDPTLGVQMTDLAEMPAVAEALFADEGSGHVKLPPLIAPLTMRPDADAFYQREIENLKRALDGADPDDAFLPAVTPGQVAFNLPNARGVYGSHREYIEALGELLAPEYHAIVDAGFNLQLDSPDSAAAFHHRFVDSDMGDPRDHLETGIEVLNEILADIPPEKVRYHVCWGNYRGPHHHDIPLADVVDLILKVNARYIYVEGANPRHEHEWEVWKDVPLPDDKALIVGVVDTKTNTVEHPRVIAQRIERYAQVVGRERVIAGTDCGFATFVGWHACPPEIAWLKLKALVDGADLASRNLW